MVSMQWYRPHVVSCMVVSVNFGDRIHMEGLAMCQAFTKAGER